MDDCEYLSEFTQLTKTVGNYYCVAWNVKHTNGSPITRAVFEAQYQSNSVGALCPSYFLEVFYPSFPVESATAEQYAFVRKMLDFFIMDVIRLPIPLRSTVLAYTEDGLLAIGTPESEGLDRFRVW